MKKFIFSSILMMSLPYLSFFSCAKTVEASPAARAIAYHTTLRFLHFHSIVRTGFLKKTTFSMLNLVENTSNLHQIPINAHLKASSLAWKNVQISENNLAQVYDNSYYIALNYLSRYGIELNLLNETFSSFESDLSNLTRPW